MSKEITLKYRTYEMYLNDKAGLRKMLMGYIRHVKDFHVDYLLPVGVFIHKENPPYAKGWVMLHIPCVLVESFTPDEADAWIKEFDRQFSDLEHVASTNNG